MWERVLHTREAGASVHAIFSWSPVFPWKALYTRLPSNPLNNSSFLRALNVLDSQPPNLQMGRSSHRDDYPASDWSISRTSALLIYSEDVRDTITREGMFTSSRMCVARSVRLPSGAYSPPLYCMSISFISHLTAWFNRPAFSISSFVLAGVAPPLLGCPRDRTRSSSV